MSEKNIRTFLAGERKWNRREERERERFGLLVFLVSSLVVLWSGGGGGGAFYILRGTFLSVCVREL